MKKNRWAAILLSMTLLGGCSSAPQTETNDRLQIITTIFPEYDWVMNVLGENPGEAEVTLLLDNGVDLHSYQPNAEDILKISTCDVFIYIGGESDAWVDDALKNALNEDMIVINLLDSLGDTVKEEEHVEGMQEEHDHEEDAEYDEHVWLSLRNAEVLTGVIADALGSADPDNADSYRANAEAYITELQALDAEYTAMAEGAERKTLLFGDRFPFRYLTDDYGMDYYAAFAGCSAETEASFETVVFLAGKVDELSLPAIMTIEGTNHRIAETIWQNTASKDQEILVLDSMQGTTSKDVQNGISYLSIMEKNLEVLKTALN
ncbi:MAG: zinc ABC transporter substrate-binding protein [Solobacterium sp.]|nr:zinc ABC transporter substrate-binding protein [Solobacterium sp.]